MGRAARTGGRLPWPLLRRIYTRIGAAEGLEPERLTDVNLASVARWLAEQYPQRRYPAVLIGSSNGAISHLAAAVGAPWLPGTVLMPVKRVGDPDRGEDAQQRLVPTFVIGDPWLTINTASVPFWSFFSVQPSLQALNDHLTRSDPYRVVRLLLFQHGADSAGIARPEDWAARTITAHGATPDFLGMDRARFPHDIGFLGRYDAALDRLPRARHLWESLPLDRALHGLADPALTVEGLET